MNDRISLTICGGTPQAYARQLQELLAFAPDQHSLVLLAEGLEFASSHRGVSVYHDSEIAGSDFARAALRQDPDNIALDQRAAEASEILGMARQTGHRVIVHSAHSAGEAHAAALSDVRERLPGYEAMLLQHDLYLQLDESACPVEIWQAQTDGEGLSRLILLARWSQEKWVQESPLLGTETPSPPPVDDSPLPLPGGLPVRGESLLAELRRCLGSYRKTAWGPVTQAGASSGNHFGGVAKLEAGTAWPSCGDCQAVMPLILELDLATCPEPLRQELGEQGTFQLFYCTASACSASEPWQPFQKNSLARVLTGPARAASKESQPRTLYPEVAITEWEPFEEGPSWEERREVWPQEPDGDMCWAIVEMDRCPERVASLERQFSHYLEYYQVAPEQIPELASLLRTATGDKLLGWPWWSQAVSYPTCPDCSRPMRALIQINNDGPGAEPPGWGSTFGQVFAADGNGHVFHCHGHLTFAWACG